MTPHIESKKEEIAKTVLMPGDPMRAKYIAEHFLEDYQLVNSVRGMLAYTGTYKGTRVTIFPSGMGMPSIGIYAYELFKFYDVDTIIRIGTAGTTKEEINLFDLILADRCVTDSSFAFSFDGVVQKEVSTSETLNQKILDTAKKLGKQCYVGDVFSTDAFYRGNNKGNSNDSGYDFLAQEMEAFVLAYLAKKFGKQATALLTVSDNIITKKEVTSKEREQGVGEMIFLALEAISNKN